MTSHFKLDRELALVARAALVPFDIESALQPSLALSERLGREVFFKLESRLPTGAFKVRGAIARLTALEGEDRKKGVVAASAGNHGLGIAWAARSLGIPALVVVPETVAETKRRGLVEMMVKLRVMGRCYDEAESMARQLAQEADATFVSPFDDPWVMAGNGGTLALELLEQRPDVGGVVLPVGGGGLASGFLTAAPEIAVLGVNAAASPAMVRSLAEGRVHETYDAEPTLAEGLEGGVSASSVHYCGHLWRICAVDEASIAHAISHMARVEGVVVEGSAAVAVAAVLEAESLPGEGPLCIVITGRNIDRARLEGVLRGAQRASET